MGTVGTTAAGLGGARPGLGGGPGGGPGGVPVVSRWCLGAVWCYGCVSVVSW